MVEATIVHRGGSEIVEDFAHIEELGPLDRVEHVIRVWYTDPEESDSDYVDYELGVVTEVNP